MAAALCTTHKKENFQRLAGLLMCGGVTLLREVFDTIHPPANLPLKLNDPATKTQLKGAKLTKPEWDCVYPSAGMCGKSTDFDITLLFRLLRTICYLTPPATGWDKLPINTDHSREADLARIKYYRNSVYGHNHSMEITDTDFASLWSEISEALLRIAGTISSAKRNEWKKSIKKLLHDPLTPDAGRYVAELQSWYKKDIDTKDEVEKLGNKMEQMNVKHDKQQEQIEMMNIMLQQLTVNHNQQMNILLEHIINIHTTIKSTKPGGSSITHSQFPNTPIVQQPGLQSETVCLPGPITPEQPDPTDLDIWQVILSSCNFPLLFEKLRMKFGVDVQSSRLGSLVITVSCSSLEILEGLWKDYSSGHLGEVIQETLVTAEVLQELCLSEVKLKTIISEEEYKACKELLTQVSKGKTKMKIRHRPAAAGTAEPAVHGQRKKKEKEKEIKEFPRPGYSPVPTMGEPAELRRTYVKHSEIPEGADYTAASGYVMMINNYRFSVEGIITEVALRSRLQRVFDCEFGLISRQLTKSEMLNELTHTAEKDFSKYDCFVCVILSDGSKDGIFGIDKQMISPEIITSLFTRDKCPSLDGKPKIFLIETFERLLTDEGPPPRVVISEDDFLIWYAPLISKPDVYFEAPLFYVVKSLEYHSSKQHLMNKLMRVNEEAESQWPYGPYGPYRPYRPYRPLYLVSTLTKNVFFKSK